MKVFITVIANIMVDIIKYVLKQEILKKPKILQISLIPHINRNQIEENIMNKKGRTKKFYLF